MHKKEGERHPGNCNLYEEITTLKQTLRKEEKRKKKRKLETTKENKEIEWQACTNRLIPSLPLQVLLSTKDKGFFWAQTIQVHFPQSD